MFTNNLQINRKGLWIILLMTLFLSMISFSAFAQQTGSAEGWGGIAGFLLAYITGLVLSFTPCVWPMYPITSSVILNSSSIKTRKTAFLLSLSYVLGLAAIYSVLGAVTGKIGAIASNYLKSVWIVSALSLVLIIFGLSMLGLFQLRIPIMTSSRFLKGGRKGFLGVFVMGLISGLVLSPCITPVVGALIGFVIQSGSWLRGAYLFFALALGMGTILVVIGTVSGALNALPKPGNWMIRIRQVFGILMIGSALYLAWPILATIINKPEEKSPVSQKQEQIVKEQEQTKIKPARIEWAHNLDEGLALAQKEGKPVMIDFTADWCAYCKLLEKNTFPDPKVIEASGRFVMIKFNATTTTPEVREVLRKYRVTGFPTLHFIDTNGEHHPVVGYVEPEELLDAMNKIAPQEKNAGKESQFQ